MSQFSIQTQLENWKSTAANILTLMVVGGAYLTANTPAGVSPKVIGWVTFATGLAKIYVGMIQKDSK